MAMNSWKQKEFGFIIIYAICFYIFIINRSLKISHDHYQQLWGLRPGWLANRLNDVSDGQWRNFRGNIPILSAVFGAFTVLATSLQKTCQLRANGMSIVWLMVSLIYLIYLHGACVLFILSIASLNFLLVKIFARTKYFPYVLWTFNVFFLICNRVYEGYSFSILGRQWAYLDNFRGTFRWHICFNFVALRMISFGCDYHWAQKDSRFDQEIDRPQNTYLPKDVALYGLTWAFSLCLVELITHFFYYNAFATSGLWKQLSALDVFIIGYGVLNFMWLKFLLIWRFFRFWSLLNGIEAPENMPKCINNCHNLESFWKSWHASFNKWLVRYLYIPLGGAQTKLLNVWVIFTFVAIWHDLEWKLLSWAWLTCIFFIPEILLKSAAKAFKVESTFWKFFFEELSAISGAVTITCLMIANLVGFVVGPSGINFLISGFLHKEGLPVLAGIFFTFYLGTKLMFHIRDARQKSS
ncbi:putative membrane-bound O-acyltransferase C24H6.01c isoform X2 [Chenopodium quinoa]|uniref:putative membrane-bound O-acyltransferase C24H6.01c isoform X2 n=1 Tax=Chenopodium quinoa TaxID=63459 RepID=UPI000B791FC6|nr:putative membrane-bound O-acyltransferase C24H6.01c isoform X2 [Chenopodium quinoa]